MARLEIRAERRSDFHNVKKGTEMTRTRRLAATSYDLDGLRSAVAAEYQPPARMTLAAFTKLDAAKRTDWLSARDEHHGRSCVVSTEALGQAFTDIHILCQLNRFRPDDREVYLISGGAGLGKTAIARSVAVNFERNYRDRQPDYLRHDECPVVMVATPAKCTPTAFDKALMTFMHYSYPDMHTHERLKSKVVQALRDKKVQVVIIDDLHRLRRSSHHSLETADLLKEYFDLTTCTFIYLGINLTNAGFFDGDAGQQILNRGALLKLNPCSNVRGVRRDEWRAVVKGLEANLRLLRHRPGSLATDTMLARLHTRTRGSLGALNKLLQTAAIYATSIDDPETADHRDIGIIGSERIDTRVLNSIKSVAAVDLLRVPKQASEK